MATKIGTSVKNFSYSGGATHTATRDITAGDCVVACISWENVETLSSVTDTAGGTWVVATQQAHPGTPAMPIGAIAYCLNHPGGTGVTVTANFSGTAGAILSMNLLCFRPAGGTSFAFDAVATPGTGFGTTFTAGSSISTAAAGVVVQYVAGYQFASGVAAGGTPTFTRDTDTESGSATDFAQYLLSGSAQTVTPGASWGAGGNEWVMLALALKEVAGGGGPSITATSSSTPRPGESLTITGTAFGASQGSGYVTLGGVVQPVTSWSDTSVTVTVTRGTAKYASQGVVVRDNALAASNSYSVTLTPPVGWAFVDLTSVNSTAAWRLRTSPDLAIGDQIAYQTAGGVVVAADATFSWTFGARAFDAEVWTSADGWGGVFTQYLADPVDPRVVYSMLGLERRQRGARRVSSFRQNPAEWGSTPLVPAKWVADELVPTAPGAPTTTFDGRAGARATATATKAASTTTAGRAAPRSAATAAKGAAAATVARLAARATAAGTKAVAVATGASAGARADDQAGKGASTSAAGRAGGRAAATAVAALGITSTSGARSGARGSVASTKAAATSADGRAGTGGQATAGKGAAGAASGRAGARAAATAVAALGITASSAASAGTRSSASSTKGATTLAAARAAALAAAIAAKGASAAASGSVGARGSASSVQVSGITASSGGRAGARGAVITVKGVATASAGTAGCRGLVAALKHITAATTAARAGAGAAAAAGKGMATTTAARAGVRASAGGAQLVPLGAMRIFTLAPENRTYSVPPPAGHLTID